MIFHSTYNKPILLVGNGVRSANASELVYTFAEKTNIPILTTMNGVDLAQDSIHIGFIGTHGNRIANMILNECDLIISVGARLGIRQVGRNTCNFAPKAKLIRCDIDEYELSRNIKQDEEKYHSDAKDFLTVLLTEDIPRYSEWNKKCLMAKEMLSGYDQQVGNIAIETIGSLLPENPIVAVDVGMNQCWCAQSLVMKGHYGRMHISGGYGTMGCALPFAIGASISRNGERVYCISGDGGFQMNIQELETVKREKLPIKIFILNNGELGKISETQRLELKERYLGTTNNSGYTVPNFSKISEAYGIKGVELQSYHELSNYRALLENNEACLFDIKLPDKSRLTPKIKFDTSIITPIIEDEVICKVKNILE